MKRDPRQRHAFDLERAGGRLHLRVALHGDGAPAEGFVDPPFRWLDVLDGHPPGERERGSPVWCIRAGETLTSGIRVENVVLFRANLQGRIEVEDGLFVTTRALAPAIETEREMVGLALEGVKRRAEARAEGAVHPVAGWSHRAHAKSAALLRAFTRGLVSTPDRVANRGRRATALLSTPEGRARVRHGLVDPNDLTPEEKAVTLFVGISGIMGALVVSHFLVTLAAPQLATPWRTVFFLFLYGFVSSIGIPLPIEPALLAGAVKLGAAAAIGVTVLAKVLAAWMVFFLGDEVNDRLHARARSSPRLARFVAASERFAQRYGIAAVALFIAIPGLPDWMALYIFGSLHMRLGKFLLGVAIGGALLYTALTLGLLAILF